MSKAAKSSSVDPATLVGAGSRLFIDTNVFMDTDPGSQGALKALVERVAPVIAQGGSPLVVPTKVVDELARYGKRDPAKQQDERAAAAVRKAANALVFLDAASRQGLVRNDLGAKSNPYADDLFVEVFSAYADTYSMTLLTNDITLLLRINEIGEAKKRSLVAGRLAANGGVELESPQRLYERGLRKLSAIERRLESGETRDKDHQEAVSLAAALVAYQETFGTVVPADRPMRDRARDRSLDRPGAVAVPADDAFSAAPDFQGPDEVLPVQDIPGEGDAVLVEASEGNQTVVLADLLGVGGEGTVYAVSDSHVVKIFDAEHITRHREAKIRLLASRGLAVSGICFPQAIVTNLEGDFVGYLMPRARGREFSRTLFNPRRFKKEFPGWTKTDLVDVAISFLEKVSYLHSLNIILGDINPKNLQVDASKEVWIIDADSWQVEGYPCPVGTDMFSAPEVIGRHYPDFLRSMEDERFAVATMLFMILITGQFPYARSGSDGDIVRLIKDGNFAFQFEENSNQDQPAGNWKYMWSHIQKGLKGLFWHTFHRSGDRYHLRPTDEEWLGAFRDYRHYLDTGNFDPMSNDVYPTRFKAMSADTPIYECADCGTSLAGIWNDKSKSYITPKLCASCRSSLPKCQGCGKHKSPKSLTAGLCFECNRKLTFAACVVCGTEKPRKALIDGRCYNCNQGNCADCGRSTPKHRLRDGLCDRCVPVACKDCSKAFKKSQLAYGRCPTCHQDDLQRQAQRRKSEADRRAREQTFDPSRLCARCGKPFITYGNVAWHERNYKNIPTTHKAGPGGTYPTECVPRKQAAPRVSAASGSAKKPDDGCFVATAIYGSYDCPEVWVLRRWRDTALRQNRAGRLLVRAYYATSPQLVARVGKRSWFTTPTRRVLDGLVAALTRSGVSSMAYQDPATQRPPGGTSTEENGEG